MAHPANLPSGFRISSSGPVIPITAPQHRQLAHYFGEQLMMKRPVSQFEILIETGIEQAQARISEMRKRGFQIVTLDLPNAGKGDQRKLYMLAVNIVLVWPTDGGDDGA